VDSATLDDVTSEAFANDLLGALAAIRRHGRRHGGRPVELAPLTGAQVELVRVLRRRPGVSVAEAAAELHVAPNTVSTLVRQLTDAGLVRRRVGAGDRRVAQLELTPDIRRKVDAFRDRRALALAGAAGRLSGQDRRRLRDALPALVRLAEALAGTDPTTTAGR